MPKKMAEITIHLECGGMIKTYIPCKSEKDLLKKLRKRHKGEYSDFGHFSVDESAITFADYVLRSAH